MKKNHGFLVKRIVEIPELQCTLSELEHEKTGALVVHISNDDPENVFCLAFRTTPDSSNGVAHIVEHTVLCGSEKYPVKDPFFAMNRRSLNTFMNALTGSDFTCYPAASQVPKDFYNLLSVYLDAAFKPLLKELSFKQEGWRLEFSKANNEKSPLQYKGIVYNEMKGALASPTTRLMEVLNQHLFPNITYGYNSGGDPQAIPSLTYEEFKRFYRESYHPSRCLFYFYGNIPLEQHLDFIEKNALENVEKLPPATNIPSQKRYTSPITKEAFYPLEEGEDAKDKMCMAIGWLTCNVRDQKEVLALSLIDAILMDTDASPLKKAILKSNLCSQAGCFVEGEIAEVPVVMILQGCKDGKGPELESLIIETLKKIAKSTIPPHLIEHALHQLEFARTEITDHGHPFGLSLFFRSALFKMHQGKPEYGLMIHSLFKELHETLEKNPRYLEELIQKYLVDNPHRVRIDLIPSKTLAKEEEDEEKNRLDAIQAKLTPQEIESIKKGARELEKFQKQQDEVNIEILPKLSISDIPKEARNFPLSKQLCENTEIFHHECFTNGITYADLVYELPSVSQEDIPYIRLFAMLISQVGCGGKNYEETLEFIQAHTGGVGAGLSLNNQASDPNIYTPTLHLSGKALKNKTPKLFEILHEQVTSLDFKDTDRIRELLQKQYTSLETSLNQKALKYAIGLASSGFGSSNKVSEEWFGLDHFRIVKQLVKEFDQKSRFFVDKMETFKSAFLGLKGGHLILACDAATYQDLADHQFYGLNELPKRPFDAWKNNISCTSVPSQARAIASQVAFSCEVMKTLPYAHPETPYLSLASFILNNEYLHPRIREQGGAYGSSASNNPSAGTYTFYAYRDPHIASSFETFKVALEGVASGKFEPRRLEEAKFEMIQGIDTPVSPGNRAEVAYSWWREGKTLELRQKQRNRILSATMKDIQQAVETHLLPQLKSSVQVVFAGKELIDKENALLKKQGSAPFIIKPVL